MKKDLEYYKNNAEEDYSQVPISVLRYISELEKAQKQGQSELCCEHDWIDVNNGRRKQCRDCGIEDTFNI